MTLSATARITPFYAGTGLQTAFAYGFKIFSAGDLAVYINDVLQPTAAYSVTGVGVETGGDVVFVTAPATGTRIQSKGDLPVEQQDLQLNPGGPINATSLELFADKGVMREWERIEELQRRPALKETTPHRNLVFPDPVALHLIGWNATADALTLSPSTILQVTPDPITGLTYIKTTVSVPTVDDALTLTASNAFPAGSESLNVAVRTTTEFGTSKSLTTVAVGDPDIGYDIWAASVAVTLDAVSNVGQHMPGIGRMFNSSARDVVITANAGTFDSVGALNVTTLSRTLTPDA